MNDKPKPKFKVNDTVKTSLSQGRVEMVREFAHHNEYLVGWKDKTASWIHEMHLQLVTQPITKSES